MFGSRFLLPTTSPEETRFIKKNAPAAENWWAKTLYTSTPKTSACSTKSLPQVRKNVAKRTVERNPKKDVRTECGNAKKWIKHSSATCIRNMGRGRKEPVEQIQKKPKLWNTQKRDWRESGDALGCRMKKNSRARKFHARATLPVSFDNKILQTSCGIIRFISSKNASGKNNKLISTTTSRISRTVLCPSGLCQGLRKKETPHRNSTLS